MLCVRESRRPCICPGVDRRRGTEKCWSSRRRLPPAASAFFRRHCRGSKGKSLYGSSATARRRPRWQLRIKIPPAPRSRLRSTAHRESPSRQPSPRPRRRACRSPCLRNPSRPTTSSLSIRAPPTRSRYRTTLPPEPTTLVRSPFYLSSSRRSRVESCFRPSSLPGYTDSTLPNVYSLSCSSLYFSSFSFLPSFGSFVFFFCCRILLDFFHTPRLSPLLRLLFVFYIIFGSLWRRIFIFFLGEYFFIFFLCLCLLFICHLLHCLCYF